jgi:hypothetical protein
MISSGRLEMPIDIYILESIEDLDCAMFGEPWNAPSSLIIE